MSQLVSSKEFATFFVFIVLAFKSHKSSGMAVFFVFNSHLYTSPTLTDVDSLEFFLFCCLFDICNDKTLKV